MILPSKHVSEQHTLIGVGALLLSELTHPESVTNLWERVRLQPTMGTFERFVLALDMLNIVGAVTVAGGILERTHA